MKRLVLAAVTCTAASLAFAQLAVEKCLPVSFGVDSRGGNRLQGRFLDARVYSRVWTDEEARAYFDQPSNPQTFKPSNLVWIGEPKIGETCEAVRKADFSKGFTFACRVIIDKIGGRLIDNATPGGYDGWIIDTYGGSVRFFRPGGISTRHPLRLETGKTQCIVVTVTGEDGITIWQNGERHRVGYRSNQCYTPIAGGYEITDGEAVFSRVLYGWHGNDWKKVPRIFVLTSDRPRVRLLSNPSRKPLGEVTFDCPGRVRYRYVFGRAEYELEGRGCVRMARSAVSEDLLVEVTGDIPAKVSGNAAERGRETREGKTYYAFNTAIDSGLADAVPSRAFRALDWYMKNVPSEIGKDGQAVIYSSNKLPRYYSSCGLYQEENLHLALACWQAGEPEIAWRHYRSAYFQTVRGEKAGPGAMYHVHERKTLENTGNFDFTDSLAMHLRSTVEGLFGIVIDGPSGTATVTPGFPSHWNEAEIKSPYFGYRWTRKGGVEVTYNPHGYKVDVRRHSPRMVGANLPPPHTNWGQPKGEGCDLSVPEGTKFAFVDLGAAANQNLRRNALQVMKHNGDSFNLRKDSIGKELGFLV